MSLLSSVVESSPTVASGAPPAAAAESPHNTMESTNSTPSSNRASKRSSARRSLEAALYDSKFSMLADAPPPPPRPAAVRSSSSSSSSSTPTPTSTDNQQAKLSQPSANTNTNTASVNTSSSTHTSSSNPSLSQSRSPSPPALVVSTSLVSSCSPSHARASSTSSSASVPLLTSPKHRLPAAPSSVKSNWHPLYISRHQLSQVALQQQSHIALLVKQGNKSHVRGLIQQQQSLSQLQTHLSANIQLPTICLEDTLSYFSQTQKMNNFIWPLFEYLRYHSAEPRNQGAVEGGTILVPPPHDDTDVFDLPPPSVYVDSTSATLSSSSSSASFFTPPPPLSLTDAAIPHTIVYNDGRIEAWYFSASTAKPSAPLNSILRKRVENCTPPNVLKALLETASAKRLTPWQSARELDIVATFYPKSHETSTSLNTLQPLFLTRDTLSLFVLQRVLTNRATGILQAFVAPVDTRNAVYKVLWTPTKIQVLERQAGLAVDHPKSRGVDLPVRVVTFERSHQTSIFENHERNESMMEEHYLMREGGAEERERELQRERDRERELQRLKERLPEVATKSVTSVSDSPTATPAEATAQNYQFNEYRCSQFECTDQQLIQLFNSYCWIVATHLKSKLIRFIKNNINISFQNQESQQPVLPIQLQFYFKIGVKNKLWLLGIDEAVFSHGPYSQYITDQYYTSDPKFASHAPSFTLLHIPTSLSDPHPLPSTFTYILTQKLRSDLLPFSGFMSLKEWLRYEYAHRYGENFYHLQNAIYQLHKEMKLEYEHKERMNEINAVMTAYGTIQQKQKLILDIMNNVENNDVDDKSLKFLQVSPNSTETTDILCHYCHHVFSIIVTPPPSPRAALAPLSPVLSPPQSPYAHHHHHRHSTMRRSTFALPSLPPTVKEETVHIMRPEAYTMKLNVVINKLLTQRYTVKAEPSLIADLISVFFPISSAKSQYLLRSQSWYEQDMHLCHACFKELSDIHITEEQHKINHLLMCEFLGLRQNEQQYLNDEQLQQLKDQLRAQHNSTIQYTTANAKAIAGNSIPIGVDMSGARSSPNGADPARVRRSPASVFEPPKDWPSPMPNRTKWKKPHKQLSPPAVALDSTASTSHSSLNASDDTTSGVTAALSVTAPSDDVASQGASTRINPYLGENMCETDSSDDEHDTSNASHMYTSGVRMEPLSLAEHTTNSTLNDTHSSPVDDAELFLFPSLIEQQKHNAISRAPSLPASATASLAHKHLVDLFAPPPPPPTLNESGCLSSPPLAPFNYAGLETKAERRRKEKERKKRRHEREQERQKREEEQKQLERVKHMGTPQLKALRVEQFKREAAESHHDRMRQAIRGVNEMFTSAAHPHGNTRSPSRDSPLRAAAAAAALSYRNSGSSPQLLPVPFRSTPPNNIASSANFNTQDSNFNHQASSSPANTTLPASTSYPSISPSWMAHLPHPSLVAQYVKKHHLPQSYFTAYESNWVMQYEQGVQKRESDPSSEHPASPPIITPLKLSDSPSTSTATTSTPPALGTSSSLPNLAALKASNTGISKSDSSNKLLPHQANRQEQMPDELFRFSKRSSSATASLQSRPAWDDSFAVKGDGRHSDRSKLTQYFDEQSSQIKHIVATAHVRTVSPDRSLAGGAVPLGGSPPSPTRTPAPAHVRAHSTRAHNQQHQQLTPPDASTAQEHPSTLITQSQRRASPAHASTMSPTTHSKQPLPAALKLNPYLQPIKHVSSVKKKRKKSSPIEESKSDIDWPLLSSTVCPPPPLPLRAHLHPVALEALIEEKEGSSQTPSARDTQMNALPSSSSPAQAAASSDGGTQPHSQPPHDELELDISALMQNINLDKDLELSHHRNDTKPHSKLHDQSPSHSIQHSKEGVSSL